MKKKTIRDARKQLRLCNAADTDWGEELDLWSGYACDLCGNCCPECAAADVLRWVWPELAEFTEQATLDEWIEWASADDNWRTTHKLQQALTLREQLKKESK